MQFQSKKESAEIFSNLQKKHQGYPIGWFRLFDLKNKKKLLYQNHNLVVGLGRQYVAQKIVTSLPQSSSGGYSLTDLPSGCTNLRDYEITHYGFGSGGAVVYTDPPDTYDLTGPDICDISLARPITFNVTTYFNDPGEINENDGIHKSEYAVKPIDVGNNIYEYTLKDYPTDDPECSYYTQLSFTLFKEEGEFGCLEAGESVQVSEMGLYITDNISTALLFARICFPPKYMEKEGQYGLEWFILC